jgi:site-specific DNA-adenine methylase
LPYFGGAASVAAHVGKQLAGARFVCVPFAGGMSELLYLLDANTIIVGDLNRDVINLANVLADATDGPRLIRALRRLPFHSDVLRAAQASAPGDGFHRALAYFVCCWMGRNGTAGTGAEFRAGLSFRTDGNGGDSAKRFATAVESLLAWRRIMPRCTFLVRDAFELIAGVKDEPENAVYVDPPWPDDGDKYAHTFTTEQQRQLAAALARFERARVVVRFGDHPLIRELYAGERWHWLDVAGRTANRREMGAKRESLIVNGELRT